MEGGMKWYNRLNAESDIVLSSRIRLARNLFDFPFPGKMKLEDENEVLRLCREAVKADDFPVKGCSFLDLRNTTPVERRYLTEKHVISPDLEKSGARTALFMSPDESLGIMINEEDHLRIQMLSPGLDLEPLYSLASAIDDFLSKRLNFAFHDTLGYLTACPSNLGTGLRASVMLHLPALSTGGVFSNVENLIAKSALALRGIYGEGSRPEGAYYQVSNQFTLGCSEAEAIEKLVGVASQIIASEREMRVRIYEQNRLKLEDDVMRSLGLLQNARLLGSDECARLLSYVRLGVSLGIIVGIGCELLNELVITTGPASIAVMSQANPQKGPADFFRADYVKRKLSAKG